MKFIDGQAITSRMKKQYKDILEKEKAAFETLTQNAKEIKQLEDQDQNFEYFREKKLSN